MPLFPPPQPIQHPADLVIDVFGTFLGKRSERMIVRWREPEPQPTARETLPADDSSTNVPVTAVVLSTTDTPTLSDVSATADLSAISDTPSEFAVDTVVSSPAAPMSSDPVIHSGAEPVADATVDANCDATADTTEDPSRQTEVPEDCSGTAADSAITADLQPSHCSATDLSSQLLQLWGAQSPGSIEATAAAASPRQRLVRQLDGIGERTGGQLFGDWQERAVPISRLRSVTVSGRGITLSSDLIAALVERGVSLSFLSGRGQPVAQLSAPGLGGTVQTRRSQLAAYDTPLGVELAVEFIRGKLRNQRHQLQYSGKYLKSADPPRFDRLGKKVKALAALRKQLVKFTADHLDDVRDKLMGYEGTGARIYWEGVGILLEGRIDFPGRSTRGALDPVNSALNYGYGILYGQVSGAVVNAGLEMYAGFLHVDRPGKPALVLDLVEEFRAPIVDRAVLAIVNQGIALETDDHGLTSPTRKLIAQRILERLSTPVPYEGKRWPLGAIIQNQARHLAVAVRGEREYRAFASRW